MRVPVIELLSILRKVNFETASVLAETAQNDHQDKDVEADQYDKSNQERLLSKCVT